MTVEEKKETECERKKEECKRDREMSLAFHTEKGEGKTDKSVKTRCSHTNLLSSAANPV